MLRSLNNRRAQVMASEYILVFFLVVGMISTMTVYFRRLVQARMRDGQIEAFRMVKREAGQYFNGNLHIEYEPYYLNTTTNIDRTNYSRDELDIGATTGIYTKTMDDRTSVNAHSQTLPPALANMTER